MKHKYPALDGLRFFAAYAVVLYHYAPTMQSFAGMPTFLRNVVEVGPIALGFFYMLSGFVLTRAYENRPLSTPGAPQTFWLARIARLYPVYLLAFVLFAPIAYVKYMGHAHGLPSGRVFLASAAALNVTALQAWTPLSNSWNGPSWSLSVEAFFYFLFPFIVRPVMEARWRLLAPVLVLGWIAMNTVVLARNSGIISYGLWHGWIQYCPIFWLPMFVAGIALSRFASRWTKLKAEIAAAYSAGAVVLLIALCALVPHDGKDLFVVYGGSAPLLALIIIGFTHPTALTTRFLGMPAFAVPGAVSYVTYILQAPLWHGYQDLTNHLRHVPREHSTIVPQFVAYLAFLLVASFVVRTVVERPAQRWLLSRFSSPRLAEGPVPAI